MGVHSVPWRIVEVWRHQRSRFGPNGQPPGSSQLAALLLEHPVRRRVWLSRVCTSWARSATPTSTKNCASRTRRCVRCRRSAWRNRPGLSTSRMARGNSPHWSPAAETCTQARQLGSAGPPHSCARPRSFQHSGHIARSGRSADTVRAGFAQRSGVSRRLSHRMQRPAAGSRYLTLTRLSAATAAGASIGRQAGKRAHLAFDLSGCGLSNFPLGSGARA